MSVPPWMTGGDPRELQTLCSWDMVDADTSSAFMVRTRESQHGKSPRFLQLSKLADSRNANDPSAYSRMNRLRSYDGIVPDETWEYARAAHTRLTREHPEESTALLMSMQILISAAPSAAQALEMTQKTFAAWMLPAAQDASCYLIEVSEHLGYRYSATRALLNTHDPDLPSAVEARELLFESARGLFSDTTFGLSAYLDCMCSSLSPEVWAFPIGRPGAVILLVFGSVMSGQANLPRDKIQLLSPSSSRSSRHRLDPGIEPKVFAKAAGWWIGQLNVLFSIATEPANYEREGAYDPSMALEKLLTLEQVFRDCQSIATLTRDEHARLSLAFQALVRIQGLVPSLNWKKVAGLAESRKALAALKSAMPREIQSVFLPRAERAVNALEKLEDGFFLANRAGEKEVRLPRQSGEDEFVSRSKAVAEWLLLYRNSLHGFDKPTTPRQRALLSSHDGQLPAGLADLAWLQLLVLMARPQSLARFRNGTRKG